MARKNNVSNRNKVGKNGKMSRKSKTGLLKKSALTTDGNSVTIQYMGKKQPARPAKNPYILSIAKKAVESGAYTPVEHAKLRLQEREVTIPEIEQVIKTGHREPKKDEYKLEHKAWNYSICGKTVDKRNLRIAVSLDRSGVLIITVIDLDKKDG